MFPGSQQHQLATLAKEDDKIVGALGTTKAELIMEGQCGDCSVRYDLILYLGCFYLRTVLPSSFYHNLTFSIFDFIFTHQSIKIRNMANDAQDKVKALLQGFSVDEIASLLAGADVYKFLSVNILIPIAEIV